MTLATDQRKRNELHKEQVKQTRTLIKDQAKRRSKRILAISDEEWNAADAATKPASTG
jgi:hypothetical protein